MIPHWTANASEPWNELELKTDRTAPTRWVDYAISVQICTNFQPVHYMKYYTKQLRGNRRRGAP